MYHYSIAKLGNSDYGVCMYSNLTGDKKDIVYRGIYIACKSKCEKLNRELYSTIERGDVLEYGRAIIIEGGK